MTDRDPLSQLPKGLRARFLATLGGPIARRMAHWGRLLEQINALEPVLQGESDAQLRKRSLSLRFRAKSGERLDRMLVEAFALVREAAVRTIGTPPLQRPDDRRDGTVLRQHRRDGHGRRQDADRHAAHVPPGPARQRRPLGHGQRLSGLPRCRHDGAGLSFAGPDRRRDRDAGHFRQATCGLRCDITYGTAKEFGFDFLRDRLLLRRMGRQAADFLGEGSSERWDQSGEQPVQRGPSILPWWTKPTAC